MSYPVGNHIVGFPTRRLICQLMAKRCVLSTGNLPPGGLSRNSVAKITGCPDMTLAVDH